MPTTTFGFNYGNKSFFISDDKYVEDKNLAYYCKDYHCELPVEKSEDLLKQIKVYKLKKFQFMDCRYFIFPMFNFRLAMHVNRDCYSRIYPIAATALIWLFPTTLILRHN